MSFILELDRELLLLINGIHHEITDPMVRMFSGKAIWIVLYIAIAATIWWRLGWRRALVTIIAIGIAVGLSDLVCNTLIRQTVGRLRPSHPDNEISALIHLVDGYRSGIYGFPSCHACNSVALALLSSAVLRSRSYTIFITIWAMLQCYSRLYLGVHYPGDIIVGGIIGAAISYCIYRIVSRYINYDDAKRHTSSLPVILVGVGVCLYIIATNY